MDDPTPARPHRDRQTAKQDVELDALHQLALGAHRIKRFQEHGAKQHLRRDRRAPNPRMKCRKIARAAFSTAFLMFAAKG
jgi:hypothetical protein